MPQIEIEMTKVVNGTKISVKVSSPSTYEKVSCAQVAAQNLKWAIEQINNTPNVKAHEEDEEPINPKTGRPWTFEELQDSIEGK